MYVPKLGLGVRHVMQNIDYAKSILENIVREGTKVGTEAYSYPIDNKYFVEEAPEFFNAIGDFVVSKGGLYLPLQRVEDFIANKISGVKIKDDFEIVLARLINEICVINREKGIHSDFDYKNSLGYLLQRLNKRLRMKHNVDFSEQRDNSLVELTKKHLPEIIIVGYFHLPALMSEYPEMQIKIIP